MAVLSSADRSRMPAKSFAGPNRSFPVSDPTHARMAISGATRSEHAGNISGAEADKIKGEARAKLHEGGGMDHKAAVAKMHPDHVHALIQHAMSGKAGPEAQRMAQSAMQPPQGGGNQQDPQPQAKMSPFSDNDADDGRDSNGPAKPELMSKASMFGMGG